MILKMAFRNIFRHKVRTFLTMFMIFSGIFMAIFGVAVNNGMSKQAINNFIRTDIGTILIYPADYYNNRENNNPIDFEFDNEKYIRNILDNSEQISNFSPRIVFSGSFTNGIHEFPIMYIGIETDLENNVFRRNETIISGDYLEEDDFDKILLGRKNAELMNLKTGDYVSIIARDYKKGINAYNVKIQGIFETGNMKVDDNTIFITRRFAEHFSQKKKINEIVVITAYTEKNYVETVANELKSVLDSDYAVVPWYDEIADFLIFMKLDEKGNYIFNFLILLMAGLAITNTLIMSVFERKKEIGILFALGFSRKKMLTLFTGEGIIVGFFGAALAVIIGGILVMYMRQYGIYIPMGEEYTASEIPIGNRIYGYITPLKMFILGLSGIFISAIASLYPAYFATKLNPVEIMKE